MKLFPKEYVAGIFRGFSQGGLEFHADLVLPYRNDFQSSPMHGHFVLVQLEHENEAVLGRITSMSSEGRLASGSGEDFGLRAVAEDRAIPEDLREQYLKYRVNIRVLGVVRVVDDELRFVASHRRLPHVGSKVAFLCDEVLREIAGHNIVGAELGFFALGEFIYSGDDKRLGVLPWMQIRKPTVVPKFPIKSLVSRRSFVFARAGFGKSNLNKLLFSSLYKSTPTVEKRGGKQVPVGTVIFDPDGEYFWPDDKSRPGLCDVPHLEDKVVVFTSRQSKSPFYQSFVAGRIKLDIRRLRAGDVISIALPPEKQDQQNVRKLKSVNDQVWKELVDEIHASGNAADPDKLRKLLHLESGQEMEVYAARANMTAIVRMLHDPSSQMMDKLLYALKQGKICVVDVSQLRGSPALVLSGLVLQKIFDHNQEEFTEAEPATIPTIAVVEEAQSVLSSNATSGGEGPYVAWVKEGRKYDLGAVLITQQPGSISGEILSQGDNWFIFHLLSAGDLQSLKKANAHFSDDILSALLNEPIEGHGIHWSSAGGRGYPIPIRVLSFESLYTTRDPLYDKPAGNTFATQMLTKFGAAMQPFTVPKPTEAVSEAGPAATDEHGVRADEPEDFLHRYSTAAIEAVKNDSNTLEWIERNGAPWRAVVKTIEEVLPDVIDAKERNSMAYNLVPEALDAVLGKGKWGTEKRPKKDGRGYTTYIVRKNE